MLALKVSQLHREAVVAERIASFWQKQIDFYGEAKAEAFYTSLGLNHLESKSIEWEGLTLSRQPNPNEELCIKGVAQAQDAGRDSLKPILLDERTELIDSGMAAIKKLEPADYHSLVVSVSEKAHAAVRNQVNKIFNRGRRLIAQELSKSKQEDFIESDDEELDTLTDVTDSRLANDVQARITAAVARFTLLGLAGNALWDAVRSEVETGSVSYIDRAATGLANRVLNFGRMREAQERSDEWERVEYSAILDQNVCGPCAAEDGQEAADEADLQPAPNPECEGGDWCRCFHVFIAK